jgi:hypothetical protein
VAATPTRAQSPKRSASLSGTVYDVNRAVITNASVILTNQRTGKELKRATSWEGNFAFELVEAGNYSLKVEANGFVRHERDDIDLVSGDHQEFCVTLGVQTIIDTIPIKRTRVGTSYRSKNPSAWAARKHKRSSPK